MSIAEQSSDTENDPIAARLKELRTLHFVAASPLVELADDLYARAQAIGVFDAGQAERLYVMRQMLVEKLEAAADRRRWISVQEAAELAGNPESTVRYWCRRGLVSARKAGNGWEIDRESLWRRAA